MTKLGITLPLHIYRFAESFAIEDAAGRSVAHVYFCDDEQRRGVTKQVSRAEAQRIAQVTARALTEAAEQGVSRPCHFGARRCPPGARGGLSVRAHAGGSPGRVALGLRRADLPRGAAAAGPARQRDPASRGGG